MTTQSEKKIEARCRLGFHNNEYLGCFTTRNRMDEYKNVCKSVFQCKRCRSLSFNRYNVIQRTFKQIVCNIERTKELIFIVLGTEIHTIQDLNGDCSECPRDMSMMSVKLYKFKAVVCILLQRVNERFEEDDVHLAIYNESDGICDYGTIHRWDEIWVGKGLFSRWYVSCFDSADM